ncbi:MAG: hypothetical protein ACOXZM_07050 [Eubacteriales bacterium]|jgi:hypothetical protein
MNEFKKRIKVRVILGGIFCTLLLIPNVVLNFFVDCSDFTEFVMGFFLAIEAVVIVLMAKYVVALRNEEDLKKLYIKETDERRIAIRTQAGRTGLYIVFGTLIIVMLISGYFSKIVFFTLLGVVVFTSFVMLLTKLYYKKKL